MSIILDAANELTRPKPVPVLAWDDGVFVVRDADADITDAIEQFTGLPFVLPQDADTVAQRWGLRMSEDTPPIANKRHVVVKVWHQNAAWKVTDKGPLWSSEFDYSAMNTEDLRSLAARAWNRGGIIVVSNDGQDIRVRQPRHGSSETEPGNGKDVGHVNPR